MAPLFVSLLHHMAEDSSRNISSFWQIEIPTVWRTLPPTAPEYLEWALIYITV